MSNQIYPLFQQNYIDYLGRLRYLQVVSVIGNSGFPYYFCTVDGETTYIISLEKDGQWHEYEEGPTVLADELGSLIEGFPPANKHTR